MAKQYKPRKWTNFSIDVRTPDPTELFLSPESSKKQFRGKSIDAIGKQWIAHELAKSQAAHNRKRTYALNSGTGTVKKEMYTVQRTATGGTPIKAKTRKTKPDFICDFLAKVFTRLVARTPFDEDYERRTNYKSTKAVNKIFIHKADNSVVKNEWYMKVTCKGTGKSVVINPAKYKTESYEYKFESIFSQGEYENLNPVEKQISSDIYGITQNDEGLTFPINNVKIWNTNPRVDQLEYGRYKKKDVRKKDVGKGEKRYHGTHQGYSVQAPRGFIGLTMSEIDGEVIKNAAQSYKYYKSHSANDAIGFSMKIPLDKYLKSCIKQLKSSGKTEFDEHEILEQLFDESQYRDKITKRIKVNYESGYEEAMKKLQELTQQGASFIKNEKSEGKNTNETLAVEVETPDSYERAVMKYVTDASSDEKYKSDIEKLKRDGVLFGGLDVKDAKGKIYDDPAPAAIAKSNGKYKLYINEFREWEKWKDLPFEKQLEIFNSKEEFEPVTKEHLKYIAKDIEEALEVAWDIY